MRYKSRCISHRPQLWRYTSLIKRHLVKGAVCRIDLAVEPGISVQIQNIGDGYFHPAPPPQTHTQVARLMKLNMLCCPQTGNPGC